MTASRSPLVLPSGPTESDIARAPADIASGASEGDFRAPDSTSLVKGKAVLLPRDGAPIARARGRRQRGGRERARALRRRRRAGRARSASTTTSTLPITVISGEQGAAAAATLITGGPPVTMWFTGADADANPEVGLGCAVLVDRPHVRRRGQARPRRPGRRDHDVRRRAAATSPSAARPSRRRRSPAPPRSCGRRTPAGRRASCAARSSVPPARLVAWTATAPRPSRRRAAAAVDIAAAMAATVVASPASLTFGLARASRVNVNRVLTLTNTSRATIHVSVSLGRDGEGADGATISARGRAVGPRDRPGRERCPSRSRCGPTGCPRRRP